MARFTRWLLTVRAQLPWGKLFRGGPADRARAQAHVHERSAGKRHQLYSPAVWEHGHRASPLRRSIEPSKPGAARPCHVTSIDPVAQIRTAEFGRNFGTSSGRDGA